MAEIITQVIRASLFASIMIIIVFLLKTIFNSRINLKLLSLLWAVVLVRLLLPYTFNSPLHFSEIEFKKNQSTQVETETQAIDLSFLDNLVTTVSTLPVDNIGHPEKVTIQNVTTTDDADIAIKASMFDKVLKVFKSFIILDYCFIVWLIGAIGFVSYISMKSIKFNRAIMLHSQTKSKEINAIIEKYRDLLGINQEVKLVFSKMVTAPITFRAIKPVIIMPHGFIKSFSKQKLELMILHEMCHIKRKDIAVNMFWMIAKIIHWFNPLVWLAYKEYVQDMELACDAMVVSNLSTKQSFVYSQSLIDVIRFSKKESKLPFVLSFCEDKTKLRRRVENMLKPKNNLKVASVVCVVLILIMTITGFTTACMPSSDKSAINNTVKEEVKGVAENETEVADEIPTPKPTPEILLKESLMVSDIFQKEIELSDGLLKVNADAQVVVPDVSSIPIISVKAGDFTQDQVSGWMDALFKDEIVYEKILGPQTKKEIEEEIEVNKNNLRKYDYDEESVKDINMLIERLEGMYESAPDESKDKIVVSDGKLKLEDHVKHSTGEIIKSQYVIQVTTNPYDFQNARMMSAVNQVNCMNVNEELNNRYTKTSTFMYDDYTSYEDYWMFNGNGKKYLPAFDGMELDDNIVDTIELKPSEVVEMVEKIFSDAGMSEFKVSYVLLKDDEQFGNTDNIVKKASNYYYEARVQRTVNGVPYTIKDDGIMYEDDESMRGMGKSPWNFERITVNILGDKISNILWTAPVEIGDVVENNSKLMNYNDIISIFDENIESLYSCYLKEDYFESFVVDIDAVKLEYTPMTTEQHAYLEGVLVPVWNFYGIETINANDGYVNTNPYGIVLTVNALDGSVYGVH